jgi:DNA ligase 1
MTDTTFGPLYAKATNGKIKMWECKVYEQGERVFLKVSHGYEDGKKADDVREVFGKNIGKKNETTPWTQACFDATSKQTKKMEQGYAVSVSEIKQEMFLPMLAHKLEERKHYLKYPCFVQPKLNGVRCLVKNVEYISRGGKSFNTLSHMNNDVNKFLESVGNIDGEIFNHEFTFQEIISAVKKVNPQTPELQYWIYDIVNKNESFEKRNDMIRKYFDVHMDQDWVYQICRKSGYLVEVPTYEVKDENDINFYHKKFTELGFEGTIIRNKNGMYILQHRSNDLLKHKDFIDEEFEIIGAKSATGNDIDTAVFLCITKDGREFDVRPIGSRELRRRYLSDFSSIKGKLLTVKFQNYSDEGTPIFGRGIAIRDYE